MPKSSAQSGFIQLLLMILLIVGIGVGIYLLRNPQIFKSRATNDSIVIKDSSGNSLPTEGNLPVTSSQEVKLELTFPDPPTQ